jgi:hypothetical protein
MGCVLQLRSCESWCTCPSDGYIACVWCVAWGGGGLSLPQLTNFLLHGRGQSNESLEVFLLDKCER